MKYVFFCSGPLSNWYTSGFTISGRRFSCVEQWMMWYKASMFGDVETAKKILATSSPKECKELGRSVSGFDGNVWDMHKERIVYLGVLSKFSQNTVLKQLLLDYPADAEFAEASSNDPIWGIGLSLDSTDKYDPLKWRGQNLLGKCLTKVRDSLL